LRVGGRRFDPGQVGTIGQARLDEQFTIFWNAPQQLATGTARSHPERVTGKAKAKMKKPILNLRFLV
jgi:hypothetical protein